MQAHTTRCQNCDGPLPPRASTPGRPPDYCSRSCRQAAYRRRRRSDVAPAQAVSAAEAAVKELAGEVLEETRHLLRLLQRPDAPLLDPVEQAVVLNRSVEKLTAGLVGRARLGRVSWAALGPALAMQPDTARRTYRAQTVNRRTEPTPRHTPPSRRPLIGPTDPTRPPHLSRSHLSPVLSRLHLASQLSIRALAIRLEISISHASQILSGERFPDWPLTERFAQACGADPLVLRTVWENEKLREDQRATP